MHEDPLDGTARAPGAVSIHSHESQVDEALGAALHYASLGFRVFPVTSSKKPPRGLKWTEASTSDPEQVKNLWSTDGSPGVAIATGSGSGIWVLDIDVGKGKAGDEELARLLASAGLERPKTLTARTPSGGKHLFFRWDPDRPVRNRANVAGYMNLDVRGEGGYIVAAPTVRGDGRAYTWERSEPNCRVSLDEIAEAPRGLTQALFEGQPAEVRPRKRRVGTRAPANPEERATLTRADLGSLSEALASVPSGDRDTWARVGLCLAFYAGEDGWDLFDDWSRKSAAYDQEENVRQWDDFMSCSAGLVKPQSIFSLARRAHGWTGQRQTQVVPPEIKDHVGLKEAPSAIKGEILAAIREVSGEGRTGQALVYAPMSAGKTYSLPRVVAALEEPVVLAVRNYKNLAELQQLMDQASLPYVVRGGVGHACHFKSNYKSSGSPSWWKRGACSGCPERKGCPVFEVEDMINRDEEVGVILTVHAAVQFLPAEVRDRPVVYDEMPETVVESRLTSHSVARLRKSSMVSKSDREHLRFLDSLLDTIEDRVRACLTESRPHRGGLQAELSEIVQAAINDGDTQLECFMALDGLEGLDRRMAGIDPLAARQGQVGSMEATHIERLSRGILGLVRGTPGVAVGLREVGSQIEWSVIERLPAPPQSVVLDGTAQFNRDELRAWTGGEVKMFGVGVQPHDGSRVTRVWARGRRFNRSNLTYAADQEAGVLASMVAKLAEEHCASEATVDMGFLVSKFFKGHLVKQEGIDREGVGHFGRDDVGTNFLESRDVLVTVGDYHTAIDALTLRAACLGVDSDQLIENRRCSALLQAGARGRFERREGEFLAIHVGALPPPGWTEGTFRIVDQPNQSREKEQVVREVRSSVKHLVEAGMSVTVDVMMSLFAQVSVDLSRRKLQVLLKEEARQAGRCQVSVPGLTRRGRRPRAVRSSPPDWGEPVDRRLESQTCLEVRLWRSALPILGQLGWLGRDLNSATTFLSRELAGSRSASPVGA